MPVLDTQFKCRNGHTFTANAKLRTRCPECGELTKRSFTPVKTIVEDTLPKPTDKPVVRKTPILVREGRPRLVPTKPTLKKAAAKKPAPAKKAPIARKSAIAKPPVKSLGKTASGIVRTHKITRVALPKVTGVPKRTAVARHVRVPRKESLMDSVMRRFGPG